jgi:hypothetical protein
MPDGSIIQNVRSDVTKTELIAPEAEHFYHLSVSGAPLESVLDPPLLDLGEPTQPDQSLGLKVITAEGIPP